jgi:phosphatidylinositol glycan class B
LLIALSAWFIISKLCLLLLDNFKTEKGKKLFVAMSMLLWFAPYINVRFSSENLAGITFLYAIYSLLKLPGLSSYKKMLSFAGAGLLLGFTFFFRFQMGFAIAGLSLWLLLINKINLKSLLVLFFAGSISIFVCIYIDYWFYGNWILSPVNYFNTQIVHDVVSNWGVSPWWYYFVLFTIRAIPPISFLLLIFFFIGLYKTPKNIFVWCIIPFIIAHFAVGHKEIRFMFPMLFCFIFLAAIGIDNFIATRKYIKLGRILFIISVLINIPILAVKMITPAQEALSYYKFLYNYSSKKEITLLCNEKNIYELVGYNVNFYKSPAVKCIVLNGNQGILNYLNEYKPDSIFLFDNKLIAENKFTGYKNESVFCLFPKWLLHFNINNWESRSRIWDIHELKKIKCK